MNDLPIDINCDMGESIGDQIIGQDDKLMPYITSCNIACGFHGGDPFHMKKTIELAIKYNVRMGAHPSYPDLEGFGRRKMSIEKSQLKQLIISQIETLKKHVESFSGRLSYVKPHGALYNKASIEKGEAEAIVEAIQTIDPNLAFMGLAGSVMERVAHTKGIKFIAEAFCDRQYENDSTLMSRAKTKSVFSNVNDVLNQVRSIVLDKEVVLDSSRSFQINADSICIHGDNPMALDFLVAIHQMFRNRSDGD